MNVFLVQVQVREGVGGQNLSFGMIGNTNLLTQSHFKPKNLLLFSYILHLNHKNNKKLYVQYFSVIVCSFTKKIKTINIHVNITLKLNQKPGYT
jgi:hypothetical protein